MKTGKFVIEPCEPGWSPVGAKVEEFDGKPLLTITEGCGSNEAVSLTRSQAVTLARFILAVFDDESGD